MSVRNPSDRPAGKSVLLMATCLCDTFFPSVARAAVGLLEHAGCEVHFPRDQTCCGQPAFNAGHWQASRAVALHTSSVFESDLPVVVPSGSCAAMHQHGHPLQFGRDHAPAPESVASLARRTWEICDYLVHGLGRADLGLTLPTPRRVAIHDACHNRGSRTGTAVRALLRHLGGADPIEIGQGDQCCGFGGTFAVAFPHVSSAIGTLKLEHLDAAAPDLVVSTDMSCLLHLSGLAGKAGRTLPHSHVVELLASALPAHLPDTRAAATP